MNETRRRFDPLAVAVLGGAAAVALVLAIHVLTTLRDQPASEPAFSPREWLREAMKAFEDPPAPPSLPKEPPVAAKPPAVAKPPAGGKTPAVAQKPAVAPSNQPAGRLIPGAGRTWTYAVEVDPPLWTHPVLTYRTVQEGSSLGVHTDFRHAKGSMKFRLGTLAPNDPGHANTRFPGFFLYTAYIEFPLQPGQQLFWSWPWQMPDGSVRKGRVKSYVARVAGWEELHVPEGIFNAVRIEANLSYLEQGKVHATAKETIWIAPQRWQVVRIVREGATPDEGARRIVAQLLRFD